MLPIERQGLVLDPPAADALAHGHFFELAAVRNYHLMMASGLYRDQIDDFLRHRRAGDHVSMYTISGEEFDRFSVTPVAYHSTTDTRLYRITRNP